MSSPGDGGPVGVAGAASNGLHAHWDTMKRILVATDGSVTAADAISFAVEFASTPSQTAATATDPAKATA